MSIWSKFEGIGGLVSGVAALIVAGVALQQTWSSSDELDRLLATMDNMSSIFEDDLAAQNAISLHEVFRSHDWKPMSATELFETSEIQGMGISERNFILAIKAGLDRNLLEFHGYIRDRDNRMPVRLIWRPEISIHLPEHQKETARSN